MHSIQHWCRTMKGTMTRLRFGSIPLTLFLAVVPFKTFAAGFLGPIVPTACKCANQTIVNGSGTVGSAPDFGCILQVLQNLIKVAVSLGVIFMIFWIAYAGFMLMVSGGSAQARSQGRTRVTNALVGIFVILCAWLIVDFVMKAIYEPNAVFSGQKIGPWNAILAGNGDDLCIKPTTPTAISVGTVLTSILPGTGPVGPSGTYGGTGAQCSVSNTACSVNTLEGYGLSSTQANVMSCIAMTESSGNPIQPPYNQTHPGSNSTACGTFQITQTTWNRTAGGSCSSFSNCMNPTCNAQVAASLVQRSGYSDWTCPGCNNKAQGCVVKYGGS